MKKILIALVACILSISLIAVFASCEKDKKPASEPETTDIAATSEVEATDTVETTDVVTEEPVSETTEEDTTDAPVTEG